MSKSSQQYYDHQREFGNIDKEELEYLTNLDYERYIKTNRRNDIKS